MSIAVLLADDERLVRGGFRRILESEGFRVVADAGDGREAVEAARRTHPDVVLMDIRMPNMDGLEATRQILAGPEPRPRVLVLTTFDLDDYVYREAQDHPLSGTAARKRDESVPRLPPLCVAGLPTDLRDSLACNRHLVVPAPRVALCANCRSEGGVTRDACLSSLAVVYEGRWRHPLRAESNTVLGDSAPRPRRRRRSGDESCASARLLAELSTGPLCPTPSTP